MNVINFVKTAIRDYRVGALTVTSQFAVRRVQKEIKPSYRFIVEYGAGDGVMTKNILRHLPKNGRVIAVELNKTFLPELTKIKDPRLVIIHDDVRNVARHLAKLKLPRIDAIVSSIPFSFFSPRVRQEIINASYIALASGGSLIIYQYSPMVLSLLKHCTKSVRTGFEPKNLPPLFIMTAEKP